MRINSIETVLVDTVYTRKPSTGARQFFVYSDQEQYFIITNIWGTTASGKTRKMKLTIENIRDNKTLVYAMKDDYQDIKNANVVQLSQLQLLDSDLLFKVITEDLDRKNLEKYNRIVFDDFQYYCKDQNNFDFLMEIIEANSIEEIFFLSTPQISLGYNKRNQNLEFRWIV
ncbi:hypothetical protein [Breznakia pachnodae]|uniref:Uridine kinase n=1 Tax=Breznakia pachnodae TaxID=265178 RepID=A0ABU0E3X3_9FIRM|nr:hypothetical protein [Breznakia pachnodae]MDQ0361606.1 uridine kinase [Breznakia pachnodae]